MKKTTILLSALLLLASFARAENYPYRSDYLWLTVPDHADWIYETGEDANIEISFYKYGIPQDVEVSYEVGNDLLSADRKGTIKLKNGRATLNIGTSPKPAFRDLRLSAKIGSTTYSHHVKVGFSPNKIEPAVKEPSDFISFWEDKIREMRRTPLEYELVDADEYSNSKVICKLLKLRINKAGQVVYGYLFIPRDATEASCPVVLNPPGAGIKTISDPTKRRFYAEEGFIRLETEIHGLDPRLSNETFKAISNSFNARDNGYLVNGLADKDRYYMKHVYLSLVRAIDFLTSLKEWDGKNVIVQGGSQGGALSLVAAGIDQRVTHCVVNHPALSDMAAYNEGLTGGYPHLNKIKGIFTPDNIATLAYYDVVNFARHVSADTYMTWGYNDNVCPPTTSYAVWNSLKCFKECLLTPINEHWVTAETDRMQLEWIQDRIK